MVASSVDTRTFRFWFFSRYVNQAETLFYFVVSGAFGLPDRYPTAITRSFFFLSRFIGIFMNNLFEHVYSSLISLASVSSIKVNIGRSI